jgi:putative transposase
VSAPVVTPVLRHFLQSAEENDVGILAYCFMPDHAHLLLEGQSDQSGIERAVIRGKQLSGYWFHAQHGDRLWQKSSWDRALRGDEDTLTVIRYIVANPVRAGLVARPSEYPFSGSGTYSWEQLESAFDDATGLA